MVRNLAVRSATCRTPFTAQAGARPVSQPPTPIGSLPVIRQAYHEFGSARESELCGEPRVPPGEHSVSLGHQRARSSDHFSRRDYRFRHLGICAGNPGIVIRDSLHCFPHCGCYLVEWKVLLHNVGKIPRSSSNTSVAVDITRPAAARRVRTGLGCSDLLPGAERVSVRPPLARSCTCITDLLHAAAVPRRFGPCGPTSFPMRSWRNW